MVKNRFKVEENLDYYINRTSQAIKNALFHDFKEHGHNITPEQWSVLAKLYYEDGISQKQIGDCLFKDKPTITRILDLMEKKNLIIRISDDKDRRKFKIYLTADGKNIVTALMPIAERFLNRLSNGVSEQELEVFIGLLGKLEKNALK
jgi:MarR family transcriptional regulator, organic hydroperoxide resistance regulator